jgi:hypothetical protein
MRHNDLLELWEIRLQRILNQERHGFMFYRRLLKHYKLYFEGSRSKEVVEKIMRDELRHVWLAKELLGLVRAKVRIRP